MNKVAILISGTGSNAAKICESCLKNEINAKVVCVGSDNIEARGLEYAKKNNIHTFVIDYKKIISNYNSNSDKFKLPADFDYENINKKLMFCPVKDREKYLKTRVSAENELLEQIMEFEPDLLVLAGFMRTLTPYFIDRFSPDPDNPKIMNIHPALLPSFPGTDGYGDTFDYGCKIGGCTVHFVDYGTDTGPIILQKSFEILPGDSIENVRKKGIELEWQTYPLAVKLYFDKKIKIIESLKKGVKRKKVQISLD
ncbi:MAG: phosphoribosylglycinamide formyltransferase [Desulfobacteraceae bacterium]|nr:phosphoribosylglycinamide formyltransferase [Desulfobacteraceae bacterium]